MVHEQKGKNRIVVFAGNIGRTRNDAPCKRYIFYTGETLARIIDNSVFARTARADHQD